MWNIGKICVRQGEVVRRGLMLEKGKRVSCEKSGEF